MEVIKFDRFHLHGEITEMLHNWASAYPQLTRLFSAGESPEGRQLWVMEITNKETGCGKDKPAYFINGDIHAGEVSGSATCLYTIQYLLNNYEQEALVTHVLDTRTVYIMPRIAVDGSEYYLTTPNSARSAARIYPRDPEAEPADGLAPQDIDGNGYILQMRVPDPLGQWKVSPDDSRLMIKREGDDFAGEFFNVYPEGLIHNYDGVEVKVAPPAHGMDFNRNWPSNWAPEHIQRGAGIYPLSEPETKAVADFVLEYKNIFATLAYHTTAGVFLRPLTLQNDDKIPPADLEVYKALTVMGEETAKMPTYSLHHQFWKPTNPTAGSYLDWVYEGLGIYGIGVELWNILKQAGIDRPDGFRGLFNRTYQEQVADELKILAWNDRELKGEGFINWYPFEHPQLGPVELGGWKSKEVRQNIPGHLLEEEIHGCAMFTIRHTATSPLLTVDKLEVTPVADGCFRIQLVAANAGYLPTNVSDIAVRVKVAKPVEALLEMGPGLELIEGRKVTELGHIAGFSRKQASWVVKGSGELKLTLQSPRAGTVTKTVKI